MVFLCPFLAETEAEMENKVLKAPNVTDEIISVIRSNLDKDELIERLNDYHENDIAQSLE